MDLDFLVIGAQFFAEGDPKGQPRVKAFTRALGGGKHVAGVYTPAVADAWKMQVTTAAMPHRIDPPETGPFRADLCFQMPRPKSHYHTRNALAGQLREDAPLWHAAKPDIDNLAKAVLDALTDSQMFWKDDAQVCCGEIRKIYTNAASGCAVTIYRL